jgi:beta-glucosidase
VQWLWKEWANVLRVRNDGVPMLGFTWYSLTDQVDWDSGLREANGRVNAVGLFDLDRRPRPVALAYRELIRQWRTVLPTQSVVLALPVVPPGEWRPAAEGVVEGPARQRHTEPSRARPSAPPAARPEAPAGDDPPLPGAGGTQSGERTQQ